MTFEATCGHPVARTGLGCRGRRAIGPIRVLRRRPDGRPLPRYLIAPVTRRPRQQVPSSRAQAFKTRALRCCPEHCGGSLCGEKQRRRRWPKADGGGHERNTATRRSARAPNLGRQLPEQVTESNNKSIDARFRQSRMVETVGRPVARRDRRTGKPGGERNPRFLIRRAGVS